MIARYGRTRLVLLGAAAVLLAVYAVFAPGVWSRALSWLDGRSPVSPVLVVLASLLLVAGHVLRAQRTRLVVDNAYPGGFNAQFGALSIGYFFNALLPLKLGELVRSWLLARKLRIGLLYTLSVIVLERLLDVVLISALLLVGSILGPWPGHPVAFALSALALLAAAALLAVFLAAVNGNRRIIRLASVGTGLFNKRVQQRLQFSIWTVIYGFQRIRGQRRVLVGYLAYFASSWACYFAATGLIASAVITRSWSVPDVIALVVGPFVPTSTAFLPVGPGQVDQVLSGALGSSLFGSAGGDLAAVATAAWFVVTVPIAAIGLGWSFFYSVLPSRSKEATLDLPAYENKLDRYATASGGLPGFLDAYFRGENLVHVLHELEVRGDLTLVRMFKGGSNAVTILSRQEGELAVRKVVPIQHADKLAMQHDWLQQHAHLPNVVELLGDERGADYYAISLAYVPTSQPLFEYVHSRSTDQASARLDEVWDILAKQVYRIDGPTPAGEALMEAYVEDRLLGRLNSVSEVHPDLRRVRRPPTVTINGRDYQNLDTMLAAVRRHPQAWRDLCSYRASTAVHGDLTVDNILVDTRDDSVILIDPSDDNQVRGPVIDFGRHLQSLRYGYEFLNADDSPVDLQVDPTGGVSISYPDIRSAQYAHLEDHVRQTIAPALLTPEEQRSVRFHAGLFYGRMLSHRVAINPDNVLKYYATAVVALDDYMEQYR